MREGMPVALLVAALTLTACQAPPAVALEAHTKSYTVDLELDAATLGLRTATIKLDGPEPTTVTVTPIMSSMKMTGTEQVATKVDDGRYEVHGEFFPMLGNWQLDVRIDGPAGQETAAFETKVVP